jgi:NAD(P) transhydrogenase beta subunit
VGRNDVANPGAKTTQEAPIYGMPILNVEEAGSVAFVKRSMRPRVAGIDNDLLYDRKTSGLSGEAKVSLGKVLAGGGTTGATPCARVGHDRAGLSTNIRWSRPLRCA